MKGLFFSLLVPVTFIFAMQLAQAQAMPCNMDCQVNHPSQQDIVDILNDLVESSQAPVVATQDTDTGAITVTLADGTLLSVEAIGLTLRRQNMQQRQLNQLNDGSLHLRSQAGVELRIRAAIHRTDEIIGEMYRAGWNDFYWFDDGIEVNSPQGDRLCLSPDMEIASQTSTGSTSMSLDADGNLVVVYSDGIRQRLHACAHDPVQLRDQVRSMTQQQLVFNADGTFTLDVEGVLTQFRLRSTLLQSGVLDQPGFFTEGTRTYFRYRDGWEQEIVSVT